MVTQTLSGVDGSVLSTNLSKAEEPTDAGRGPQGRPRCLSPGPASWGHSDVSKVSPHRTRVVTAGPLRPDPAAFLRNELARASSDSPASAPGGPPHIGTPTPAQR